MPAISVIIPIYNSELWLDACIGSILAQTFNDFELILIDDGSSDSSAEICNRYGRTDGRIRVIHKTNGGTSAARAEGVRASQGEFVFFADSDDSLEPECLENLYEILSSRNDIDIAICNLPHNQTGYLDNESYREKCISGTIYPAPWGKLYRRNLFNEKTFDIPREIVVGEDMLMNIRCAFNTDKGVYLLDKHLYNYNNHTGNTSHRFKRTPEYENVFMDLIIGSLPPAESKRTYMNALNGSCYRTLLEVFDGRIDLSIHKKWIESDFYTKTIANIRAYGSPTTRLGLAKIKYTSAIPRFFILLPSKLVGTVRKITNCATNNR